MTPTTASKANFIDRYRQLGYIAKSVDVFKSPKPISGLKMDDNGKDQDKDKESKTPERSSSFDFQTPSQSTPSFSNSNNPNPTPTPKHSRPPSSRRRRSSANLTSDDPSQSPYLASPQVRHFSAAYSLPQFRNRLAALSLTASSSRPSSAAGNYSLANPSINTVLGSPGLSSDDVRESPTKRVHSRSSSYSKPSLSARLASSLPPISSSPFNSPFMGPNSLNFSNVTGSSSSSSATIAAAAAAPLAVNNFIVFDIGNRFVRAGFAGDIIPRCEIPVEWAWQKIEQNIHNDEILNHRKRQADTDFGEPLGETFIDSQYSQESIFLKDLQSDCINWLWNLSTISLPYTGHVASKSFEQKSDQQDYSKIPWYKTHHKKRLECVLEVIIRHIFFS